MNHLEENNDVFKVEDGIWAYSNYQKYGIEWYHNFVWKGKDSPHFFSALKEAQIATQRRQKIYLDAMIWSPGFLEKYFWKDNMPFIQEKIDAYVPWLQEFSKPAYVAALDAAYTEITNDRSQVIAHIKSSKRYISQQNKQAKEIEKVNKLWARMWALALRKEIGDIQKFYLDAFNQKVQDFYDKKEQDIVARKKEYCKDYFLRAAEKRVWEIMYSPMEMKERDNIRKWLESTISDIKIEDRTDEITNTALQYNGESAISAINATKSMLKNQVVLREHLFNLLVEIVEMQYYQALLRQTKETKNLVVKKPPLIDDFQSWDDFVVIDPDNKNRPYKWYDLKTTMNKSTIANEVTANKYDKWIVKNVLKNADLVQEMRDKDPQHDLLNNEIKIRKKRPLWWLYAAEWQKWPLEKFVVEKDILWFPSNLAYTLLSRVMAKVSVWHTLKEDEILHLVSENNEDFQKLTTFMQSDISESSRLVSINQSCSNLAKSSLLDVLTMKRTW